MSMLSNAPPASAWQEEYARVLPQLEALARRSPPPWRMRVMPSSQLDAQRLDLELGAMLQEQLAEVFKYFGPSQASAYEEELQAALALLVFWLSIWQGRATPGSELMNLRYRNEAAMDAAAANAERCSGAAKGAAGPSARGAAGGSGAAGAGAPPPPWLHGGRTGVEGPDLSVRQRLAFGLGYVLLPYLWSRASKAALDREWSPGGGPGQSGSGGWWRLLRGVEGTYRAAALANLWLFLFEGKYRTLMERLLRARLVYRSPSAARIISFEYLNRQLVLAELSEFLLSLLPLLSLGRVKAALLQALPRVQATGHAALASCYPVATSDGSAVLQLASSTPAAGASGHPMAEGSPAAVQQQSNGGGNGAVAQAASPPTSSAAEAPVTSRANAGAVPRTLVGPCPICGASEVLVPFLALPCRHIFCYVCLRAQCEADTRFSCPLDSTHVTAMRRLAVRVPPPPPPG